MSLASRDLERDDFCNALPRFVAENAVDLLSAGAVDQVRSRHEAADRPEAR